MSNTNHQLITELRVILTRQRYSPVVAGNYCAYAREFVDYLARRGIEITDVTEAQVAQYLRHAIALFRKRHGRAAGPRWHSIPRSGIHAPLRLAQGQWPPALRITCVADAVRFTICDEYESWLREERGLARPSIVALLWEARHFLAWQLGRCGAESLMELNGDDIDLYMDLRAPKLTRKSLKDVAERLRSLLRYLHRTGRTAIDLSPHVIAPLLYAYEGIPSIIERGQIAAVLESARKDTTPVGLRDHAILQLLATYGLRSSEVRNLRLDDIDWRADSIRVRHTKTRACSFLPLMEPVGEAVLAYLRSGRPETDAREIFIRTRGPIESSKYWPVRYGGGSAMPASSRPARAGRTSSAMPARSRCCARRCRRRSLATCSVTVQQKRRHPTSSSPPRICGLSHSTCRGRRCCHDDMARPRTAVHRTLSGGPWPAQSEQPRLLQAGAS
jgi:site-specific recombinase XerD